jgi:hypothetical protein
VKREEISQTEREAQVFAYYYVHEEPPQSIVSRYVAHINRQPGASTPQEMHLVALSVQHPRLLPFFDAGLALLHPQSELRRRLFVMFALLEASTPYTQLFLPMQRKPWYVVTIIFTMISAGLKAIVGSILLKVLRVK